MNADVNGDPRAVIKVRELLEALQEHATDGRRMTSTQVSAAIALLKKVLPDLPGSAGTAEDAPVKTHEEALKELDEAPPANDS